jgi:hypothetical protein
MEMMWWAALLSRIVPSVFLRLSQLFAKSKEAVDPHPNPN